MKWTRTSVKLFKFVIGGGLVLWMTIGTGWWFLVFYLGYALITRIVYFFRLLAARRRRKKPFNDARPHVLYLRRFRADAFKPAMWFRVSTDEVDLEIAVRPLGDLIAIGRPGEFLPTPGAAREYSPHNEWQNTVSKRMSSARLVIIRAGQGDHLLWECEQAFSMLSPHQVVFLILDIRADEFKNFATTIHARLGIVLPVIPNVFVLRWLFEPRSDPGMVKPGFIVFSEQWRAQFMPFKPSQRLVGEFQKALRPVFDAQGVAMGL
jgi:hypothetical protein